MRRFQRIAVILCACCGVVPGIAGCVVYETTPGVYSASPGTSFDRSWSAALGAFADEGVQIVEQNRGTGTIRGTVGDVVATGRVLQQADGNIRVEFDVSGNLAANPSLKDRIVGSYNRRMGR
jgi:hypothetical protein